MLSQIIRFTLLKPSTISAPAFSRLRQKAAAAGARAQYFGYTMPTESASIPRNRHEICWVILWSDTSDRGSIAAGLEVLAVRDATSLLLEFDDTKVSELEKALEASVCEFAFIRLSDDTTLSDAGLQKSMHKTYTDTYKIAGFTGGQWGYALDSNESRGRPLYGNSAFEKAVPAEERRLGVYLLGWESIELHQDATETPEFAEEIVKLMPHMGPGSGYAIIDSYFDDDLENAPGKYQLYKILRSVLDGC